MSRGSFRRVKTISTATYKMSDQLSVDARPSPQSVAEAVARHERGDGYSAAAMATVRSAPGQAGSRRGQVTYAERTNGRSIRSLGGGRDAVTESAQKARSAKPGRETSRRGRRIVGAEILQWRRRVAVVVGAGAFCGETTRHRARRAKTDSAPNGSTQRRNMFTGDLAVEQHLQPADPGVRNHDVRGRAAMVARVGVGKMILAISARKRRPRPSALHPAMNFRRG